MASGGRPLQTYLGGGDLDGRLCSQKLCIAQDAHSVTQGDEYCVTMLPSLVPKQTVEPASYTPAQRMTIDRPSTMQDVADFVTNYITSDVSCWVYIARAICIDATVEVTGSHSNDLACHCRP